MMREARHAVGRIARPLTQYFMLRRAPSVLIRNVRDPDRAEAKRRRDGFGADSGAVRKRASLAILAAIVLLSACSDATHTPGGGVGDEKLRDGLIVSGPIGTLSGLSASGSAQNVGAQQVYISMPPGTLAAGDSVKLGVVASSVIASAPMGAGGFDPVAITASVGDSLDVSVFSRGAEANHTRIGVSALRQPSVVRTTPARGRTDVPLNQQIVIVFTQPLDATTVTGASIQLSLNGTPVSAVVNVEAGAPWVVTLSPSALLSAKTQYRIDVATTIKDANGLPLVAGTNSTFSTSTSASAVASISVVANGGYFDERRDFAVAIIGASADFTASTLSASGDTLVTDSAATFLWSSSDHAIATVTSSGLPNHQVGTARAVGIGTANIAACLGTICGIGELFVRSDQSDVKPVVIPELSGVYSRVTDMKGDMILGSTRRTATECGGAFVVSPSRGLESIGAPPGQCDAFPDYINVNGEVLGEGAVQPDGSIAWWSWTRELGTRSLSIPNGGKGTWIGIGIDADGDITFRSDSGEAAIQNASGLTQILNLPAGTEIGVGLNDRGQIVLDSIGAPQCGIDGCYSTCGTVSYVWNVTSSQAVSTLRPRDPNTGDALGICAWELNSAGTVSGIVFPTSRPYSSLYPETAFRWTAAKGFEFFQVDPGATEPIRINESGDVSVYMDSYIHVGEDSIYDLSAAIWLADGRVVRLGSLGGDHTAANGLNEQHMVAGHSQVGSSTGPQQAVTWDLSTLANSQTVSSSPPVRASVRKSVSLFQNSPHRPIPREYALRRTVRRGTP
jgi:hypothetical protein